MRQRRHRINPNQRGRVDATANGTPSVAVFESTANQDIGADQAQAKPCRMGQCVNEFLDGRQYANGGVLS